MGISCCHKDFTEKISKFWGSTHWLITLKKPSI